MLGLETTEKITRRLRTIPGVVNIYLDSIKYSSGSDSVTKRLIVQMDEPTLIDKIDKVCKKIIPVDYSIRIGKFTKPRPTVSDYLRK